MHQQRINSGFVIAPQMSQAEAFKVWVSTICFGSIDQCNEEERIVILVSVYRYQAMMGVDLQVGGNYVQCCSKHNFNGFSIISTRSFYKYYEDVQGKALVKEMCMSQQKPCSSGYICSHMLYPRAFGCVFLRNFCSWRYSDQTFTRWTSVVKI